MAYTGSDYFMKVQLSGSTQSKVRDFDLNTALNAKGSMVYATGNASDDLASLGTLAIGTTGQVLTVSNGIPAWTSASAAAGVNDAKLQLKIGSAAATDFFSSNAANAATLTIAAGTTAGYLTINGTAISVPGTGVLSDFVTNNVTSVTSLEDKLVTDGFAKTTDIKDGALKISINGTTSNLFTANQSTTATLTIATGSTNGAISFNGTNVMVKGLGSAAFTESSAYDAAGAASTAETNAKNYADDLISGLGNVMEVKGTTNTVPTGTTGNNTGDVWIVTAGDHAGEEYVWTGSAWELMGTNSIDLSGYVPTTTTIAGLALTTNISATALTTALGLGSLAKKNSASATVTDYATGISLTATNSTENINVVKASGASKISNWNGGSAAFVVNDGVLSLNFTAATATIANATETAVTITHKAYSGSLVTGNKTITVS